MTRARAFGSVLLGCVASISLEAAAQNPPAPEFGTDAGMSWIRVGDEFLPPPSGPGPITFDKKYPYVPNGRGRQPTYRVADLTNPILQPWAAERMKKANDDVIAGKVPFRARERCWPAGVPAFLVFDLIMPVYFIQTPAEVTIVDEGDQQIRRVYLNAKHSAHPKPSWYGESVGHYENGDTLVVDTIGLSTQSFIDNYRTPHTEQEHVVERFTLRDGGKTLEVSFTVDDPGTFTTAWSGVQRFRRRDNIPLSEEVCAENNADFFHYEVYPLPQTDKPDF